MKLIFAGTPEFAVPSLRLMLEAGFVPDLVLTQPDRPAGRGQRLQAPPVKELALREGLPVAQPERLADVRERIEAIGPEVMVVVAYAHKIPPWLLDLPAYGCLNVHASLLPRYRGAAPVAAAILNGDAAAGVSIMRLEEGWDTGPVLDQRAIPIEPADTTGTLTDKLALLGGRALVDVLRQLPSGQVQPRPQDHARATYVPKLAKEDGRLDWSKPAERLAKEVRAYSPWPGSFTSWQGRQIKVWEARAEEDGAAATGRPGLVLSGLRIVTGAGLLALDRVQLEGRKAMPAKEFLAGQPHITGTVLG